MQEHSCLRYRWGAELATVFINGFIKGVKCTAAAAEAVCKRKCTIDVHSHAYSDLRQTDTAGRFLLSSV